jgi:hypothetical protein
MLTLTLLAVAVLGLGHRATRRLLYLGVAGAFVRWPGEATPIWQLYRHLPGGAFRGPVRSLWATSFALPWPAGSVSRPLSPRRLAVALGAFSPWPPSPRSPPCRRIP